MSVRVFISWSGPTSERIAEVLADWLPSALQITKPFFTPNDLEKGSKWSNEITSNLLECDLGIICLTSDNLLRPWINFEAGALSNRMEKSNVCTALFGIKPTEVNPPLGLFQHTSFTKEDFQKLLSTINSRAGSEAVSEKILMRSIENWWPELKQRIDEILNTALSSEQTQSRTEKDKLDEILELARASNYAARRGEPMFIPGGWFRQSLGLFSELVHFADENKSIAMLQKCKDFLPLISYIDTKGESKRFVNEVDEMRSDIERRIMDIEIPF